MLWTNILPPQSIPAISYFQMFEETQQLRDSRSWEFHNYICNTLIRFFPCRVVDPILLSRNVAPSQQFLPLSCICLFSLKNVKYFDLQIRNISNLPSTGGWARLAVRSMWNIEHVTMKLRAILYAGIQIRISYHHPLVRTNTATHSTPGKVYANFKKIFSKLWVGQAGLRELRFY